MHVSTNIVHVSTNIVHISTNIVHISTNIVHISTNIVTVNCVYGYEVATISRLLKITGLFCKRAP